MKAFLVTLILSFTLAPIVVKAELVISEVMYDPAGTDSNYEWIEVCNTGATTLDMATYKLFESGSAHALNTINAPAQISASSCAVIAEDAITFKKAYPDMTGSLFDSSFSLSNSGEELRLRNAEGVDVDTFVYVPETGASGTGSTLHRATVSTATLGAATPGSEAGFKVQYAGGTSTGSGTAPAATGSNTAAATTYQTVFHTVTIEPPPQITLRAELPHSAVVGSATLFSVEVYNAKGGVVDAAITWTISDGGVEYGKDMRHTFEAAGKYTVRVTAKGEGMKASDVATITVIDGDPRLTYDHSKALFMIENVAETELDLTGYTLQWDGYVYRIPDGLTVSAHSSAIIPRSRTAFTPLRPLGEVLLRSPLGKVTSTMQSHVAMISSQQGAAAHDELGVSTHAGTSLHALSTAPEAKKDVTATRVTSPPSGYVASASTATRVSPATTHEARDSLTASATLPTQGAKEQAPTHVAKQVRDQNAGSSTTLFTLLGIILLTTLPLMLRTSPSAQVKNQTGDVVDGYEIIPPKE